MSKYLYGAAVQGIQDFIFKTNELKHIVGASELVEQICTSAFDEFAVNGESIVRAAGNIKYVFNEKTDCEKAVREFPKKVMTKAPGITISQAVILLDDDFNTAKNEEGKLYKFGKAVDELESRLKTQRNKVPQSVTVGLMGIKRTNNTGLPVTSYEQKKEGGKLITYYYDDATSAKLGMTKKYEDAEENESQIDPKLRVWDLCEKSFGIPVRSRNIAYDISKITGKNDWIAIIHADGNGFGQVIQKVGKDKDKFKVFSRTLDIATRNAARTAFTALLNKGKIRTDGIIPIRPVVLDGDDMTAIIRGDLAIDYATEFIKAFENETGKDSSKEETGKKLSSILEEYKVFEDGKNYLTACAGIAFIKSSYPFYYGYQLAEELCGQAKKDTKALAKEGKPEKKVNKEGKEEKTSYLPNSCLMFHKVQDSFITSYDDIVKRELTITDKEYIETKNNEQILVKPVLSFKAGPYYLEMTNRYTISDLNSYVECLDSEDGNGVKSGLRQWITSRIEDKNRAIQRNKRMLLVFNEDDAKTIKELTKESLRFSKIKPDEKRKYDAVREDTSVCIAYDALAYHTIMNQQTKE